MRPSSSGSAVLIFALAALGCTPKPKVEVRPPLAPARAEHAALERLSQTFQVSTTVDPADPAVPLVGLHLTSIIRPELETRVEDEFLADVAGLTRLRTLRITSARVTGTGFKHLAGLTELRELDVSSSWVNDDGIRALPVLPNLEGIELRASRVTDAGVADLRRQPKLARLRVGGGNVTVKGLAALAEFPALTEVSTGDADWGDAELAELAKVPRLERLTVFAGDRLSDDGLARLAKRDGLRRLHLELERFPLKGLATLRALPHLADLDLRSRGVNDEVAGEVAGWARLRGLNLGSTPHLSDAGLWPLLKLKELDSLGLNWATAITSRGMIPVGKMTHLRTLDLSGTKVGDDGLRNLAGLTGLRRLGLNVDRKPGISSAGLRHLGGMTELEHLDLFSTRVTDADVPFLAGFKKLKEVTLFDTGVTFDGAERLRKELPGAKVNK